MKEPKTLNEQISDLLVINRKITDETIHTLVAEIITGLRQLMEIEPGRTEEDCVYSVRLPAIIQMAEYYADLDDPEENERNRVESLLEVFLNSLEERIVRYRDREQMEMKADMKMLEALLGSDGMMNGMDLK